MPLTGRTIVVTRARGQASKLTRALRDAGARPLEVPAIAIEPPDDGGAALRDAVRDVGRFAWVVVTSPNGADALVDAASDPSALRATRVAVVGPATGDRLRSSGIEPALVPQRFVAEGLLEVFPHPSDAEGNEVLLAQAAGARDVLRDGLRADGWLVHAVDAYKTVAPDIDPTMRRAIADADAITFTSASTVENFVAALGATSVPPTVASIGPVTSAAARSLGVEVTVEASEHTIDGLVDALSAHFRETNATGA
jgi:uroporphyrinogen-III synthase